MFFNKGNKMERQLNVSSKSKDWREYCLSNFPAFPFTLDDKTFASVEGFVQGIKLPPGHPNRELAFISFSIAAKRLGEGAEKKFVWYADQAIPYRSQLHYFLIERAIRAKFEQNSGARLALLASKGYVLVHDTGTPDPPDTSLPREEFCRILTKIRDEL
jgi:predicted NAD-dependent protein-ADP-ribosyltransferase YbiA (DUF1768 family)